MKDFIRPEPVEDGDKVAVVGTSSGIKDRFPGAFHKGVNRLREEFDLELEIYDSAEKSTEYLLEHPQEKAEDIMEAFRDPEVKGLVAVTGGDEQMRVLKHLDPEVLRENPTRFYGISDNTNLHIYLWKHGIESFYGGQFLPELMADGELWKYTSTHLEKAFFEDSLGTVEASESFSDEFVDLEGEVVDQRRRFNNPGWEFWNFDGEISGRLFGGCFEIVYWQLAADRFLPRPERLEGTVLALETSEEAPTETEIKRWLMTMGERGFLNHFSAILVGRPVRQELHGEERSVEEKEEYHERQKQRIQEEIQRYAPGTPVVFDVDFGHTDPKIPLQLGSEVVLRPEEEEIEFR